MYKFVETHKISDLKCPIEPIPENVGAFYACMDLTEAKSFCLNFGGYPRSDIALINEEMNVEVANQLAARLVERHSDGVTDVSDSDIIASHRSRYCQSPAEMIEWIYNQLSARDAQVLSKLDEEEQEKYLAERDKRRKEIFDSLNSAERDAYNAAKRQREIGTLFD